MDLLKTVAFLKIPIGAPKIPDCLTACLAHCRLNSHSQLPLRLKVYIYLYFFCCFCCTLLAIVLCQLWHQSRRPHEICWGFLFSVWQQTGTAAKRTGNSQQAIHVISRITNLWRLLWVMFKRICHRMHIHTFVCVWLALFKSELIALLTAVSCQRVANEIWLLLFLMWLLFCWPAIG